MSKTARTDQLPKTCPHCESHDLYTRRLTAGNSGGGNFLLGLGSFLHYADFDVVVCASCGLTQLFAEPAACHNVKEHTDWKHV